MKVPAAEKLEIQGVVPQKSLRFQKAWRTDCVKNF